MTVVAAHIGRANRTRLQLLRDGEVVTANTITRAQFRFGTWCLDTNTDSIISLIDNNTVVEIQLGRVTGITPGTYRGLLTVYDASHPQGIAWATVTVTAANWPVCS